MHDMTRRNFFDAAAARERCLRFRKRILDISQQVQALHIGSAYSCTEMVDCIYYGLMRRNPDGTANGGNPAQRARGYKHRADATQVPSEDNIAKTNLIDQSTSVDRIGHREIACRVEGERARIGNGPAAEAAARTVADL